MLPENGPPRAASRLPLEIMKILVIIILLAILGSLASGLVFLIKDKGHSKRAVKALTWRISLSMGLFLLLMIGYATGLLRPHGIIPAPPAAATTPAQPAAE